MYNYKPQNEDEVELFEGKRKILKTYIFFDIFQYVNHLKISIKNKKTYMNSKSFMSKKFDDYSVNRRFFLLLIFTQSLAVQSLKKS